MHNFKIQEPLLKVLIKTVCNLCIMSNVGIYEYSIV